MKLIVDAQLSRRLARWLATRGHDVLHTLDLPDANATRDTEITDLACREGRIVVSKDGDFVNSHLIQGQPPKLLWIATGNMGNAQMEALMERNLAAIEAALASNLIVHD
jgi:predicted nuclease of predicted toxin-antitoxin system